MSDTDSGADPAKTEPPKPDTGSSEEVAKWKALARKHEDQAKANKAELDKLIAAGSASQSDSERMAARMAELESGLREATQAQLRAEVAQDKGLTKAQAKRLQGTTIDELNADADELISAFKPADDAGGAPPADDAGRRRGGTARPTENLRPGATPPAEQDDTTFDSKAFLAAVPRG